VTSTKQWLVDNKHLINLSTDMIDLAKMALEDYKENEAYMLLRREFQMSDLQALAAIEYVQALKRGYVGQRGSY